MPNCCTIEKPCDKHLTAGLAYAEIEDFDASKVTMIIDSDTPKWMQSQFQHYAQHKIPEEDFIKVFRHLANLGAISYDGHLIN